MRYIVTKDFQKISETSGTIQNTSHIYDVEVSDSPVKGSGITLYPLNKLSFNAQIYVRVIEGGGRAVVDVVSFAVDAVISGGGSAIDDSQIATDAEIDELLDNIFGTGSTTLPDGTTIATDEEIDELLDNIFGSSSGSLPDGTTIATDEEIDDLLNNIFGSSNPLPSDSTIATDEEIDDLLNNIFG